MVLLDLELQLADIAADDPVTDVFILPVLHVVVAQILAVELDGAFAVNDLPQLLLVGHRNGGQTGPIMHLVQILERLLGLVGLVVGLGQVEVGLRQTEQREFEPDARTGIVVELRRSGTPLARAQHIGEGALLGGIGHLTAPALSRPVRVARVVEGIEPDEDVVGLGTGLDALDVGHPLVGRMAAAVGQFGPVGELRTVFLVVEFEEVGHQTAHVRVVTVVAPVGRIVVVVEDRAAGPRPLIGFVALVGQQHLAVGRCGGSRCVIGEGIGVGHTVTGATRIDQGIVVGGRPGQDSFVGRDGILPALGRLVAEADQIVVRTADIGRSGVEERAGGEEQRPSLDGQHGAAGHTALIGRIPIPLGKSVIGRLAQFEDVVEHLAQRRTTHRDTGIRRRRERIADDRHTAIAVEHAHVAIGDQRYGFGLDVILLLLGHVGHLVDILIHRPAVADVGPVVAEMVGSGIGVVDTVDAQTGVGDGIGSMPRISARDLAADGAERSVADAPATRKTVDQGFAITGHQGTFRILGRAVDLVQVDGSGRVGHLQEGILTAGQPQRHGYEQSYECFFHLIPVLSIRKSD